MEGIFIEFENENSLRSYPFVATASPSVETTDKVPIGVFVDASIYPVNPSGALYLSGVTKNGEFTVSDDSGIIMSGVAKNSYVELHDMSPFKRHVGTLQASSSDALSEFANRGVDREFNRVETTFLSSCVFPIVINGVTSLNIGDSGAQDGNIQFTNSSADTIRISSSCACDGKNNTLRFDVLPRPEVAEENFVKRIICIVDGQTPFRIARSEQAFNVIFIYFEGIDKESVCSAAHRENQYEMADTCSCSNNNTSQSDPISLKEVYQRLEVLIPPGEDAQDRSESQNGACNAFYLVSPNMSGYSNPISITLEDGNISPKTENVKVETNGEHVEVAEGELIDNITSKSVIIQVPGLSGGRV